MKKVIKNNYKILIGIIIGIVIISVSIVYAESTMIDSEEVTYDNEATHETVTNVQEAIDELYERSGLHKDEWKEEDLKGNDPVITGDLIPVEIKSNGDVYYANKHSEWYNYSEKRWANAVILKSEKRETYSEGQKIEEEDINGYFVWIPRYKYQVWHAISEDNVIDGTTLTNDKYDNSTTQALGKARLINIEFESKNTTKSNATKDGEWLTHPAFTLGSKELSGIWVGKFETGGDADNVIVKPNVVSWRSATVKTFFEAGKGYARDTLDSHMMKNTEWGAVAYLSHSKYGKGTEIRINNNSDFITGYSAAANTDQSSYRGIYGTDSSITQPYNTPTGYLASTTGNISGIYDMSGGAHEYMAACIEGNVGSSGFNKEELEKEMNAGYIDKYPSDSNQTSYSKRILGDATGEMGPFYSYYEKDGIYYHNVWYADGSYFVGSSYPWFNRGGLYDDGVLAGQFYFYRYTGGAYSYNGFRLVLSSQ